MAFRSFATLSVLVAAALAQSNPLIPAGISASCTTYLSTLNTNTQIQSCLTPIVTALAAFSPTGNLASCSASTVDTALSSLCSSNACPQSTFTSELSAFAANCTGDLTSRSVEIIYDALYLLYPFRQAICSKDDDGDYCVTKLSNTSSNAFSPGSLYTTTNSSSSNSTPIAVPNPATFQSESIPFLLLQPNSSNLCTTCTRNILAPYIDFESCALYGPGLTHSLLLGGQTNLYNNITAECGSNFFSGAVAAAGGLSQGVIGAASRIGVQELSSAMGAILGVAGLVAASF